MSTITLPNIRVSSDLTVGVVLKDGGVAIDWSTLSNIKAYLYADAQRAMAGRCSVAVDEEDSTRLVCSYRANKPQYIGVNRIVITCTYRGETKTFDKPALNFVRWTDEQAGQQITIDDPDVDVEIEVEDVSSSILDAAIAAAIAAAERAEEAAEEAEHMVDIQQGPPGPEGHSPYIGENGNWFEWDDDEEAYVDSGKPSRGPEGPRGPVVSAEDTGETVEPANLSPNVQYVTQELTAAQKSQARQNIGAGTSDFTGDYDDLDNKPTIPDVAGKEDKSNKVTTIDAQSTDEQYPSAKAVHTSLGNFYTKEEIDALLLPFKIPAEYQLVEYLQGDGVAYIDLGVNNKTTFGCRADVQLLSPYTSTAVFSAGAYSGTTSGIGIRFSYYGVNYRPYPGSDTSAPNYPAAERYNRHVIQSNYKGSGYGIVEGLSDTQLTIPTNRFADTSYPFLLFAASQYNGDLYGQGYSLLYNFKLTDGSALKFDLYPVYRTSDDEPGMYDIITGTFFPNANSTGAFTVGPNA